MDPELTTPTRHRIPRPQTGSTYRMMLCLCVVLSACEGGSTPVRSPSVASLEEIQEGLEAIVEAIGDACPPSATPSRANLRRTAASAIDLLNDAADFGAVLPNHPKRVAVARAGDLASRTSAIGHGAGSPERLCAALRETSGEARALIRELRT